jgi:hypothetical protein
VIILLIVAIFSFWYIEAENYSEGAMSGRYTFHHGAESSTLVLKPDHTFKQELVSAGITKHAEGSWRVIGLGHISFTREFLTVSGEEFCYEEPACGMVRNNFGVVSFSLGLTPDIGPTFHKTWFR